MINENAVEPVVDALDVEHGLPRGFGHGTPGRILFGLALLFATFQIFMSLYAALPAEVIRAIHVGFLVTLSGGLYAQLATRPGPLRAIMWATALTGGFVGVYHGVFYHDLILRAGDLNTIDVA